MHQPEPCSALDHYPLGPGGTFLRAGARLLSERLPLKEHGSEQLESRFLTADVLDSEWGLPNPPQGFKGGCFRKPCGQLNSSRLAFFFPQLLAEMEDFLASVLIPTELRASVPLHTPSHGSLFPHQLPRVPYGSSMLPQITLSTTSSIT